MSATTTTTAATRSRRVSVGIIGCGEVTQVIHLPTLVSLSELFEVRLLCDVSEAALAHCSLRLPHAHRTTRAAADVCAARDIDVVLVASSDEFHATHVVAALDAGKHVFVEKPVALSLRDVDAIEAARARSGTVVMVGYMRRYAAVLRDAIDEVGGAGEVLYARVRDIIAPNPVFVGQSGAFPVQPTDVPAAAIAERQARAAEQAAQALTAENGVAATPANVEMWRLLSSLGSHDISLLRECLGAPLGVLGVSLRLPIWTVLFRYAGFAVTYESGFDGVPRFDARIEVFGARRTVSVVYDTPYVRGLPVTMHVREAVPGDPAALLERSVRRTYEDPYTLELKQLWNCVVNGAAVKTTPADARLDLEVSGMIMRAAERERERERAAGALAAE